MKIRNNIFLFWLCILTAAGISQIASCKINKIKWNESNWDIEKVSYEEDGRNADSHIGLERHSPRRVILQFWQEFDDTLVVLNNKKEISRFFMQSDTNTNDTFTVTNVSLIIKRNTRITVKLINKKKIVHFVVDDRASVITIQHFNSIWYLRYRHHPFDYK
ncbi:hypothetical protein [Mucilaginibacter auburnensis]|uniref:Uncharacterized protein n=1 Tax=Mucilaginibacter auburnensis TaxID=1457233 RepID=A0A2H9VNU4_9SPHI|nr:hypothetical protein [Mucilaginibacter auburnensis]PJJ79982.1 hypothetical protein CLV57_3124 [Mucilaginibacter auburnensis]